MGTAFYRTWFFQNTATLLLLVILAVMCWRLLRREYWRQAVREIFRSRMATVSFVVLCIYGIIGVLDSVGWRERLENGNKPGTAVLYDEGRTALDYLLAPLAAKQEETYSAPFADYLYTMKTVQDEKGSAVKVHPELKYPGNHVLGTDIIGKDVLYLSLKSVRTGLIVGLLTTLFAVPFAVIFGLFSGYYGGAVDHAVQFICTLLNSVPTVLFIAALMVIFGRGLPQLCIAMGIGSWTTLCRLLRGEAMRLRGAEFTQAAVASGVSGWKIIMNHIFPNVTHIIIINIVIRFSGLVLAEATLTYLGLGADADTMSWGTMINDARTELTRDPIIWWKLTGAFVFMLGLVLPANLFGDAVRDALDPRLRSR